MVQKNVSDVATYISTLSPSAQQTLLSEYCGVSEPVGGWHDSGYYAPHAGGGAFDLEYYGSPWIPLKGIDGIYHADAPTPANVAQAIIYDPCMAVWNRACNFAVGHNTTAGCQCYPVADTTSATLTTTTCDAIWELSDSVRTYFAQAMVPGINAQVDADRKTVAPGMVIGSSTYNAQTNTFSVSGRDMRALALGQPPHSSYPGSPGHYSGGVVGFNRVVVKKIHQASLANPPNPPYPASVPIANPPYPPPVNPKTTRLLQWSVFGFGSDLMHFDICHNPNQTVLPIAEVTNCQTFVEAFSTTSDGKNPWSAPGT
jgi:hypothetical protein